MKSCLRIGTRGSALALHQTNLAVGELKRHFPDLRFEIIQIKTQGDLKPKDTFVSIGANVFTREIEEALLCGKIDLAVHSAKDLASTLPQKLLIGAVLRRGDPRDALVSRDHLALKNLPKGARIGTSSLRRRAQLKRMRPDLEFCDLRGNVDTRIRKIKEGVCDGTVLASAGLNRLGLECEISEVFEADSLLPQSGQGIIALEILESRDDLKKFLDAISHRESFDELRAERAFLEEFEGGCALPSGALACVRKGNVPAQNQIEMKGGIFSLDGSCSVIRSGAGLCLEAEQIGRKLARQILDSGGREILDLIQKK